MFLLGQLLTPTRFDNQSRNFIWHVIEAGGADMFTSGTQSPTYQKEFGFSSLNNLTKYVQQSLVNIFSSPKAKGESNQTSEVIKATLSSFWETKLFDQDSKESCEIIFPCDVNDFLKRFNSEERAYVSHLIHQRAKKAAFKEPKRLLNKVQCPVEMVFQYLSLVIYTFVVFQLCIPNPSLQNLLVFSVREGEHVVIAGVPPRFTTGHRARVEVTHATLLSLIENYCREAWVRNLQKQIEKIYREMYQRCSQHERIVSILDDYLRKNPKDADLSVVHLLASMHMLGNAHDKALQHI
ncbi:unnamed protein product [Lactuca saligna]|uniref:Lon protease AAA+ ATPase lid domain-containing protein n=1 Tax=Lactuca saligna TaxID=75948 RepID=A0AA35ZNR6_LACSI|nr:unnamed protein product [Lactuca saligna]